MSLSVGKYLTLKIPLKYKTTFSKLRCSNHSMLVETGRHRNILYTKRICVLCNFQEIKDEFHVLARCTFYDDLRNQYLGDILNNYNTQFYYVYDN